MLKGVKLGIGSKQIIYLTNKDGTIYYINAHYNILKNNYYLSFNTTRYINKDIKPIKIGNNLKKLIIDELTNRINTHRYNNENTKEIKKFILKLKLYDYVKKN